VTRDRFIAVALPAVAILVLLVFVGAAAWAANQAGTLGFDFLSYDSAVRRFLGKLFHTLASIWVVGPVQDTQCGFKGFSREAAHDIFARQLVTSIVFDVEVIYLARRRGYRHAVVPVHWADRRGSRMHPGLGLAVRVAWDLFRIPLIHRDVRRVARGATDQPAV
jgi:dolichyl-phosphate beta-glucosyltransferase